MLIEPIRKINVSKQVFDQMLELIYSGQWKPEDRLPSEAELCSLFGGSRVTIRQAIQKLAALDLVETRHGEGSFIKSVSPGSSMTALMPDIYLRGDENAMQEVLEYREILEVQSCRLAAERAQPEDLEALRENVARMELMANADDCKGFAQVDMEFHELIAHMTRNSIIFKIHEILGTILMRAMQDVVSRMGYMGLKYHKEILEAIARRDADRAAALMKEHLSNNWRFLSEDEGQSTTDKTDG